MTVQTVWAAWFSATDTTRAVVNRIAARLARQTGAPLETYDFTLPQARKAPRTFGPGDLVVLGTPVYAGRVPNLLIPFVSSLRGNGALAVPVVCYGNRAYDDALMELKLTLAAGGFTPIAGLPMGTRCGDLDAGVIQYLMNKYGYSIDEMLNILNKKSGVLGVSGVSSDFRDLDKAAAEGNERAKLALDMFHYWVAKVAGSYVAAMNGVDAIVYTAGVGENSSATRAAISEYFGYLGVKIDPVANSKRGEDIEISTPDSKVKVFVIPTNEELVIARDTRDIVG